MIAVLDPEHTREMDTRTMSDAAITSLELMERAARGCAERIIHSYPDQHLRFLVLAGMGNNGGDGIAIARYLLQKGRAVRVVQLHHKPQASAETIAQLDLARSAGLSVIAAEPGSALLDSADNEVVIDALLGAGLDRPLTGQIKEVVHEVNGSGAEVIAIDLPTGLFAEDNSTNDREAILKADVVLTIGALKLALLLPENEPYVGHWELIDIGYSKRTMEGLGVRMWLTEHVDVRSDLPERTRFSHKGRNGHALLVAGSAGKMGAALLAAHACLRSGVGKLTLSAGSSEADHFPLVLPECMIMSGGWDALISDRSVFQATGAGPGIGTDDAAERMLKLLLQSARAPMVLDADALNLLAENRTWLAFLPGGSILTPHPGEFDRLAGTSTSGYERLQKAIAFAQRFRVVLVLKGAYTAVCAPNGEVHFNRSGNPGMAKGGCGDALTGILTALLAQGLAPFEAARLGVYVHGLAGDQVEAELGADGMLPTDLIDRLPQAWRSLRGA